jgi:glycosyltransferase involved in cell wall biosynthesis
MLLKLNSGQDRFRVIITGHLPPPIGGIATLCESLLESSLSAQVKLFFFQTSSQRRALSASGRFSISNMALAIRDCARFTKSVLIHRPQIAHISTAFGLSFVKNSIFIVIARLLGIRVLLHPHCSFSVLYTDRPRWWRLLFRGIIRLTAGTVAVSSEWMQLGSILRAFPIYLLPNAINLKPYKNIYSAIKVESHGRGPFKVLYLGYLGKAKGTFDLIDAAKKIQSRGVNMVFNLVGEELRPGELELLKRKIETDNVGGVVCLHSPAYGTEKVSFFRNSDLFVYPSYHEGMPVAVIEAMACGLPIVATKVGGLPDLVVDGINGLLIDPGRPDQLASAIQTLTVNKELYYSMKQKSYQFAGERFGIEQYVSKLVDIYRESLFALKVN